jgi:hypothetical protein
MNEIENGDEAPRLQVHLVNTPILLQAIADVAFAFGQG